MIPPTFSITIVDHRAHVCSTNVIPTISVITFITTVVPATNPHDHHGSSLSLPPLKRATSSRLDHDTDQETLRIDKLRKDLVFMWRSRLYPDVRIALTGNFSSSDAHGEPKTAIFSSHRFILVSRSPYFHTTLLSWPSSSSSDEPPILIYHHPHSPPPHSISRWVFYLYRHTHFFSSFL